MLKIYNSLTRELEPFVSITKNKVTMYTCGVTVYDDCHLGHGRTYIVFDMIVRYLKHLGYDVILVRNITDIDDKIINRAKENKETISALTQRFTKKMHDVFNKLNLLSPTFEPKATDYIANMIRLIATLIEKKCAYVGHNGDVFFSIAGYKEYGKLSQRTYESLQAGARIEINTNKQNKLDFVLWKLDNGEPCWNSPWGFGRPGWHTECAAMALEIFRGTFDIHGGGHDLLFPHHENEIAQAESCTHKNFANVWIHVGFLQVKETKMSKSLNNFCTLDELLAKYHPESLRYFLLSCHYRKPLDFTDEQLIASHNSLQRLYNVLKNFTYADLLTVACDPVYSKGFTQALDNDFNTPEAFAVLHNLASEINAKEDHSSKLQLAATLLHLLRILGFSSTPEDFLHYNSGTKLTSTAIEELIQERALARNNKDWSRADEIRAYLLVQGILLEDADNKTTWKFFDVS